MNIFILSNFIKFLKLYNIHSKKKKEVVHNNIKQILENLQSKY